MHKIGIIILAHTALNRVEQSAKFWSRAGCPVVIHVDRIAPDAEFAALETALSDDPNVLFCPRYRCAWGGWKLVQATLDACDLLRRACPDLDHFFLSSGSCLPLRPAADLIRYLEAHPETDFIESATILEVDWTVGGLDQERFSYYFPFSWKTERRLFDFSVRLQRRIKVRRKLPDDVVPHIGSQWWCLSAKTLSAILDDPKRKTYERYFKKVWIPDESYFQSLARKHSKTIESRSLTLSKFDYQGKPYVFYDDHLQLLRRSDCFVARKIWSGADGLYTHYLEESRDENHQFEPNPGKIDKFFELAAERRLKGRTGLYMQSRFPVPGIEKNITAAPYCVFQGFGEVFEGFEQWLSQKTHARIHGHLFHPERAFFSDGSDIFNGGLSSNPVLRDRNTQSFLTNLIWNTRGETQCFLYGPGDNPKLADIVTHDAQASLFVITGAWAIPLFLDNPNTVELRLKASLLQKEEMRQIKLWTSKACLSRVKIWTLAEFLAAPVEPIQQVLGNFGVEQNRGLTDIPRIRNLDGFEQFLKELKNIGMHPQNAGEFNDPSPKQVKTVKKRYTNGSQ